MSVAGGSPDGGGGTRVSTRGSFGRTFAPKSLSFDVGAERDDGSRSPQDTKKKMKPATLMMQSFVHRNRNTPNAGGGSFGGGIGRLDSVVSMGSFYVPDDCSIVDADVVETINPFWMLLPDPWRKWSLACAADATSSFCPKLFSVCDVY